MLGPDVRDARGAAAEARLQGGELDAEIDLLAEAYPEPSWTPESPFALGFASGLDTLADPDHLYGSPESAEAGSETAPFCRQAGRAADAGRFPLPRILPASEVSPVRAPVAATLPDGTPHADPFLAGRGWQAEGGVYVRQPQAQLEAG